MFKEVTIEEAAKIYGTGGDVVCLSNNGDAWEGKTLKSILCNYRFIADIPEPEDREAKTKEKEEKEQDEEPG